MRVNVELCGGSLRFSGFSRDFLIYLKAVGATRHNLQYISGHPEPLQLYLCKAAVLQTIRQKIKDHTFFYELFLMS